MTRPVMQERGEPIRPFLSPSIDSVFGLRVTGNGRRPIVRQRNAALHGADTVPAVLASVSTFALELQSFVIHKQLRAVTIGEPLLTALERNRIRLERVRTRLEAGESPATAIFEKGVRLGAD